MRVIGEFDLENMKVTVFKYNGRISVKYEQNLMEQVYKFRDGSAVHSVPDVEKFSQSIVGQINSVFELMAQARIDGVHQFNNEDVDAFDEII